MKMKKNIILILVVSLLLGVVLVGCSSNENDSMKDSTTNTESKDDNYKLVAAHILNEDSSFHAGMVAFKNEVEEKSDGRIIVEIHPNGALGGNEDELVQKMESGSVDVIVAAPGFMAQSVAEVDLFSLPYLFESHEHWENVVDGEPGQEMKEIIEDKTNFKVLGYWKDGVRNIYTINPVNDISDLDNIKFRIQNSPVLNSFWSEIGVQPVFIAFNEIYQALQNKVIDGAENAYSSILQEKHYEVCKNITLTEHDIATRFFLMGGKKFDSLPEDLQEIVLDAGRKSAIEEREADFGIAENAENELRDLGVTISDIDKQPLIEKTENVRIEAAKGLELEDLYEKIISLK